MSSSRNRSFLEAVSMSLTLVGFLYLVKAFEFLFFPLAQYGILPRTQVGLRGILWSPFLHGNWHLPAIFAFRTPFRTNSTAWNILCVDRGIPARLQRPDLYGKKLVCQTLWG